ncbi:MAG: hypothetical protein AAGF75_00715 [Cyanobacteria bacterium P01_H01_bin.130]
MTPTPQRLTLEYFLGLYGWLLRTRNKHGAETEPWLDEKQAEEARVVFDFLKLKGYSNSQVKTAVEYVHASTTSGYVAEGLYKKIVDFLGDRPPQPTYSIDPTLVASGQARLPPSRETIPVDPEAIALLQGKPTHKIIPNLPVAEFLTTCLVWPMESAQQAPKGKHPEHLRHIHPRDLVRIRLAADCHCKALGERKNASLPRIKHRFWWEWLNDHFLEHGEFKSLFGGAHVFDGPGRGKAPKMQSIPITQAIAALPPASQNPPTVSPFKGRLPL